MAKKKAEYIIHLFGNDQFPRRLWIVKGVPYSWLNERFRGMDGEKLTEYDNAEAAAVTYPNIEHIASKELGILIVILDKLDVSGCAHEATHFALELYRAIGDEINLDYQEVLAYLIGWATSCIYQVVNNKYKPTFDGSRELSE